MAKTILLATMSDGVNFLDVNTVTTVLVFLCTLLLAYVTTRRRPHVPPGPPLFPVVGNLPSLVTKDTLKRLGELRKQYGDVVGLYMGNQLTVFINGYEAIQEALVKKGSVFMFRAKPVFDFESVYNRKGLIFSEGALWKDGRSFALSALQEICFSDKRFVENVINEEVAHLTETVVAKDTTFDIERLLNSSVANVTFRIVFGHRFELDDSWLYWFQRTIRQFAEGYVKREVILNCLPFIRHSPWDILGLNNTYGKMDEIMNHLTKLIENVKDNSNTEVTNQSCSFVGVYLEKMAINQEQGIESTFDEENLKMCAYHLIVAGSETTATTIRWIILYLIRNPEIQERMHQEITEVVGNESPSIADRKRMPFTHAVILEGLRISNVAPLAMPHTVTSDTEFRGFLIPKDTIVIPNLNSTLMDGALWKNPSEFRPERFLNETGDDVNIPKEFIAFSLGPRSCIGETLARVEIFLYIAGLTQTLKLLPEQEGVLPDVEGDFATTFNPKPFKMRVMKR